MLAAHTPYAEPLNLSFLSGRALSKIEYLYVSARKSVGKVLLRVIAFLLLWLPLLIFALWLKIQRRNLINCMKHSEKELHDVNDYVRFKQSFEKLNSLIPDVERIQNYNINNVHFVLRFTLKQMQKTGSTVLTFHSWLKNRFLDNLNSSRYSSQTETFTFKTEHDLWQNRNKAYDYWF